MALAREHLGLFDTPPSRRDIRVAAGLVALLCAGFFLILPFSHVRLRESVPVVPVVDGIGFVGELIIATLFYAQAAVFRSRALTILASGYVFLALLLAAHALTFPGAFAPEGLLNAGMNGAAWNMIIRRISFPIIVTVYAILKQADLARRPDPTRPPPRAIAWVAGAVALALGAIMLASAGDRLLPPMFASRSEAVVSNLMVFNLVNILLLVAAMGVLFGRRKSLLDMWLLVALATALIQSLLNLPVQARFTVGWYGLFLAYLVSHLLVLIALLVESNRLYARLAMSTEAQSRERESRLMSMEAVAAAISHEVGQPLAGVTLSASAGLKWLDHAEPKPELAMQAMRDTIEAANSTFDVMKNVRATFIAGTGPTGEYDVNDLVRETTSLLERELAARKIALELDLDEALPTVRANRVQMKRVLVNLIANAIESIAASHRRPRRIVIRSVPAASHAVLVEIGDSGDGIPGELMADIFEPYFTTKPTGTGLGLALSRASVEDHGGCLWATSGEDHGATFHLKLPCGAAMAYRKRNDERPEGAACDPPPVAEGHTTEGHQSSRFA